MSSFIFVSLIDPSIPPQCGTEMSLEASTSRKRQFSYVSTGSYHDYYRRNVDSQNRLNNFQNEWFMNKRCLDIGCNEGLITNRIAETRSPAYILGIDIDRYVIDAANSILKRVKYDNKNKMNSLVLSSSSSINNSGSVTEQPESKSTTSSFNKTTMFMPRVVAAKKLSKVSDSNKYDINKIPYPENIEFQCTSISQLNNHIHETKQQRFDTILCLSVSKWIHLNEGDVGLLNLFQSFFDLCVAGGRVIFEYQPWKSYQNKRKVCEQAIKMFPTIKIRPDQFENILVSRFGFVIESRIGPSLTNAKGYNRPILILIKPFPLIQSTIKLASSYNTINDTISTIDQGNRNDDDNVADDSLNPDVYTSTVLLPSTSSADMTMNTYGNLNTRNRTMRRKCIKVSSVLLENS